MKRRTVTGGEELLLLGIGLVICLVVAALSADRRESFQLLLCASFSFAFATLAVGVQRRLSWRRFARKVERGCCGRCGYDLTGVPGLCPKCGEYPPPRKRGETTLCSFCGKSNIETGRHVEGPHRVFICPRCIDIAVDLIRKEKVYATKQPPSPPDPESPRGSS